MENKNLMILWVAFMLLFGCSKSVENKPLQVNRPLQVNQPFPTTVNDAADSVIKYLDSDTKTEIIGIGIRGMVMYHMGLGMSIRNKFGLWNRNSELLKNCGESYSHPDDCSGLILQSVWKKLRKSQSNEDLENIALLHKTMNKDVPPYKIRNGGATAFIKYLNHQIQKESFNDSNLIIIQGKDCNYRLKDYYNKNMKTIKDGLQIFKSQYIARLIYTPNGLIIKPEPFLNSENACSAM